MTEHDMMLLLQSIQKQLTFLEKKVDTLIRQSEKPAFNREFSGPRSDRPWRRPDQPYQQRFDPNAPRPSRPFNRPDRPFNRPDRPNQGFDPNRKPEHGQGPSHGKQFYPKKKFFPRGDRGH